MEMTSVLSAAERRTLGNILASGGSSDVTQGRNRVGSLRKSVVAGLVRRGLVRGETVACRYEHLGTWYSDTVYYATAAGCLAYGPVVATLS